MKFIYLFGTSLLVSFYSTLVFEWAERFSYEYALPLELPRELLPLELTLDDISCFFVTDPTPNLFLDAGLGMLTGFFVYFFCYLGFSATGEGLFSTFSSKS